ncbi:hypothetical protein [Quadrisphaera sp. DSM 44207]|uniref:hypothetical protein n=1 Tax=Quadrisphaera sp. DSM 44207 TaxID=1881057 RepID=UPI00087E2035|nr:hypothetical protein [Quadrisphaera sp. DSM 44207]SDQ34144.1 hypothetical protein SAMN05428996_1312 [Quadrisphaera sp. DSM 44207]
MAEALVVGTSTGTGTGSATGAPVPAGKRVQGSIVHLPARAGADDAPWPVDLSERDERLRRRERLLHHLEMERQRRRRRPA